MTQTQLGCDDVELKTSDAQSLPKTMMSRMLIAVSTAHLKPLLYFHRQHVQHFTKSDVQMLPPMMSKEGS